MIKLYYDLHIHSCLSPCADDDMTPSNIAGMASLKGLDVIALTDHCSALNCPALAKAAAKYDIIFIPGMEVCVSEEIHVVCLFPDVEKALSAGEIIMARVPDLPGISGKKSFGNQWVMDENDSIIESVAKPLWIPSTISFNELFKLIEGFGGLFIPAHIDRPSSSILSQLGFIPPDSRFSCVEVKDVKNVPSLLHEHEYLRRCNIISSSDAHELGYINEVSNINCVEAESRDISDIIKSISR